MKTVKCNCCGGVYDTHTPSGTGYVHICSNVIIDGAEQRRDGHRNESMVYPAGVAGHGRPLSDPSLLEELKQDTFRLRTEMSSEGAGVTVLHEGPRTAQEKNPAVRADKPKGR